MLAGGWKFNSSAKVRCNTSRQRMYEIGVLFLCNCLLLNYFF